MRSLFFNIKVQKIFIGNLECCAGGAGGAVVSTVVSTVPSTTGAFLFGDCMFLPCLTGCLRVCPFPPTVQRNAD